MPSGLTSNGLESLGQQTFEEAQPLFYSLVQIKAAVEAYNQGGPAQRWRIKLHRNGLILQRGDAVVKVPQQGVFLHPMTWGVDSQAQGEWGVNIIYNSSTGGQVQQMLREVGLLQDYHPDSSIVHIWLREWGQTAQFMLRREVPDYVSQLQGWLADSVASQVE